VPQAGDLPRSSPLITIRNLQRRVALDVPWLRRFAPLALAECRGIAPGDTHPLQALEEVAVAIVSDRRIAQMHVDFMGIAGPTDVLTFDHGDIVISAETARAYAADYEQPVDREVALYIIHGLLHLNGFDDLEPRARRRMHAVQARVMQTCLRRLRVD